MDNKTNSLEEGRVDTINEYIKRRVLFKADQIMSYLSHDVVVIDQNKNVYDTYEKIRDYYNKSVPGTFEFEDSEFEGGDVYTLEFKNTVLGIWITKLKAFFEFGPKSTLIKKITVVQLN